MFAVRTRRTALRRHQCVAMVTVTPVSSGMQCGGVCGAAAGNWVNGLAVGDAQAVMTLAIRSDGAPASLDATGTNLPKLRS